jgi:hypothetical protein
MLKDLFGIIYLVDKSIIVSSSHTLILHHCQAHLQLTSCQRTIPKAAKEPASTATV